MLKIIFDWKCSLGSILFSIYNFAQIKLTKAILQDFYSFAFSTYTKEHFLLKAAQAQNVLKIYITKQNLINILSVY